jgi:LacI family transcriptional regulator
MPTQGPRFADPYFSEILAGIGDGLAVQGYDLLVSTCPPGPDELEAYRHKVEGRRVDGLIVVRTRQQDDRIAYLVQTSLPFVVFGRTNLDVDFPYIDEDSEAGLYQLTRYLIGLGHRRIGYISAPMNLMFAYFRREGFRRAIAEAGLSYDERLVVYGDLTRRGGAQAARQLLENTPRPSAIIAGNDLMALGAIRVAQELGLRVGSDLSVAGFDDIPPAEIMALTTLRQPIYEIGHRLSAKLCSLIDGQPIETRHELLEPELIIRASSGPPPSPQ